MIHVLLISLLVQAPEPQPSVPEKAAQETPAPENPTAEPAGAESAALDDLRAAAEQAGLALADAELRLMRKGVERNVEGYAAMRARALDNAVPPALGFTPLLPGIELRLANVAPAAWELPEVSRPDDLEELAFADVVTLATLIRSHEVSCVELTEMYLARLRRLDEKLHCVVTFTEERALEQARALDAELAAGEYRGWLHGIPYGAKDLLAVPGYPTTWGAAPYREQTRDELATVVRRLDEAGAVLIAKLTLGALAMGDVWFDGRTRNPWRPEQGSSGSSAGSASATAAGGVAFSIGSETLGSIISPSHRCGCSSLRPTFGRVSRHGAMALSWSMDKLGPICRSVRDAAIVFDAIQGPDGKDPTVAALPYAIPGEADVTGWKVGYLAQAFEASEESATVLEELRALGVELVPIELPDYPVWPMMVILNAEAATAFDELTRSGRDDLLVRQDESAWPNSFRVSRLIPAVEYLRANRLRTLLMLDMNEVMSKVDLYVHPTYADNTLPITNLTGHPSVIAPGGFRENGTPRSISFTGQLYDEARLLALVQTWQASTEHHLRHPSLD